MRLKLNATKTELIWFDRRSRPDDDKQIKSLHLESNCIILPSDVVRDLGLLLDSSPNMPQHISSVARSCYFPLRRIRQVKRCSTKPAFVSSSKLSSSPASTTATL